jgi:hypothetical protein
MVRRTLRSIGLLGLFSSAAGAQPAQETSSPVSQTPEHSLSPAVTQPAQGSASAGIEPAQGSSAGTQRPQDVKPSIASCDIHSGDVRTSWTQFIFIGEVVSYGDLTLRFMGVTGVEAGGDHPMLVMDLKIADIEIDSLKVGPDPLKLPMCGKEITFTFNRWYNGDTLTIGVF